MSNVTNHRIQTLDVLKGLVMIIMALDHVRDYFHYDAFFYDATDPTKTTIPIYLTRYITHFCAPAFSFLAGLSAYMIGIKKSSSELSTFLIKRGVWLILLELTIINFAWHFDPQFQRIPLQVIWVLGASMIVLAGLIHLPKQAILIVSLFIIFGHNVLDGIDIKNNLLWSILHQRNNHFITDTHYIGAIYSLIPWIAVMSLGYCFGPLFDSAYDPLKRKKFLNSVGVASIALFCAVIAFNSYGEPIKWQRYDDITKTAMSMLNISKYPVSLKYLLITLGSTFLFLANSEKLRGKTIDFFCMFGRVPFFFYIIHLYIIHSIALFAAEFTGFGWHSMILPKFVNKVEELQGYGFNLAIVYLVWIFVIALLYPMCKRFDTYKQSHKEKWWLSYF